ncbi:MAG: hypothetical protein IRY86_10730 [Thermorudis peleae]|nr:hypothetical protein [Thermorudis peleae]
MTVEDERAILQREFGGGRNMVACTLCGQLITRRQARAVSGAEAGMPNVEYVLLCPECWRELRGEDTVPIIAPDEA